MKIIYSFYNRFMYELRKHTNTILSLLFINGLLLVFRDKLAHIWLETVVNNLIKKINYDTLFLCTYSVLIVLTIIIIWRISSRIAQLAIFKILMITYFQVLLILYFNRFYSEYWNYIPLFKNSSFLLIDPLIISISVSLIIILTYRVWSQKSEKLEYNDGNSNLGEIGNEVAIQRKDQDLFGFTNIASELVEKIHSSSISSGKTLRSFAIAIEGEWGIGKTSFTNLMKEDIKSKYDDIEVIDYSPLIFTSENGMIQDFYSILIDKIGRFDLKLNYYLNEYGTTFYGTDKTTYLTRIIKSFGEKFTSINLYERINSRLIENKTKYIVFIDDIDRIEKKEIAVLFRFMRSVVSFNNVVFVVCFDRNYVLQAIKEEINSANYNSYLDKIFQISVQLPSPGKMRLSYLFAEYILQKYPNKFSDIDKSKFKRLLYEHSNINTLRDLKRFIISFDDRYIKLQYDVDLKDFIIIELIKFHYPLCFKYLNDNLIRLLNFDGSSHSVSFKTIDGGKLQLIKEYEDRSEELNINQIDIIFIRDNLINSINEKYPSHLKFCSISSFENYFKFTSDHIPMSMKEVIRIWDEDIERFNDNLDLIIKDNLVWNFKDLLFQYIKSLNFDAIIAKRLLLFSIKIFRVKFNLESRQNPDNDYRSLLIKCCVLFEAYWYNRDKSDYQNSFTYKIVIKVLENAIFPYCAEIELCYQLYKRYVFRNDDILQKYGLIYLTKYLNESTTLDYRFDYIMQCCRYEKRDINSESKMTYIDGVRDVLVPKLTGDNLKYYLVRLVTQERPDGEIDRWHLFDEYIYMFGGGAEFKLFLSKMLKIDYIKEFYDFFEEYNSTFSEDGKHKAIIWEWKHLPVKTHWIVISSNSY